MSLSSKDIALMSDKELEERLECDRTWRYDRHDAIHTCEYGPLSWEEKEEIEYWKRLKQGYRD